MSETTSLPPEHPPAGPETEARDAAEDDGRRRYPRYVYNPISLAGAALAVAMTFAIILLFLLDLTSGSANPYLGIVGFAILPVPLVLGLLAIPVGMWLEWRREKRPDTTARRLPVIDFNKSTAQRALFTFVSGTVLFLFLTAGGSYKAYEYTESVAFCGTVCHQVMEPEYTTYQAGPHARVACVECHIGAGAEWWVRSKISGLYQVYSVTFHKYSQPIPTPIENLRPARETCERCHWPAKFHGDQMWEVARYRSDETNTRWPIRMVMRTGGSDENAGKVHGIHWHIAQQVEYVATDPARLRIREVRQHLPDGTVRVFTDTLDPLGEEERTGLPEDQVRTMDCMDCHNRPSHQYLSPRHAMDKGLDDGSIPADLPFIKREGTGLLAADYATREAGLAAIEQGLHSFYAADYPEVVGTREADLRKAVAGIQQLFTTYFFPYMKARWDAYPSHLGHQEYPGCFRCHNGAFTADDGEVIRNDCQLCHIILAQGPGLVGLSTQGAGGLTFQHPEDVGGAETMMPCSDCHTGGGY
jgi:hypothetical protein